SLSFAPGRARPSRAHQGGNEPQALPGVTSSALLTSFDAPTHRERHHVALAVWVAVHRRAAPSRVDQPRMLVQLERIGTTSTRAANAVRVHALPGFNPRASAAHRPSPRASGEKTVVRDRLSPTIGPVTTFKDSAPTRRTSKLEPQRPAGCGCDGRG